MIVLQILDDWDGGKLVGEYRGGEFFPEPGFDEPAPRWQRYEPDRVDASGNLVPRFREVLVGDQGG